jgi:hypothetical protein
LDTETEPTIEEAGILMAFSLKVTNVGDVEAFVAVTVCAPLAAPSVKFTEAAPVPSVTLVGELTLPPPVATAHAIGTPLTFWLVAVRTRTVSGAANAVLVAPV